MSGHDKNGNQIGGGGGGPTKKHNYKLLVDPCLVKGATKLYRFNGEHVPDNPAYASVFLRDPRNPNSLTRIWNRAEVLELPTPRFKIDENYVGDPPRIEVTFFNVNDNIDHGFMHELLRKSGGFTELQIFYHPETKKHLQIARVTFDTRKGAKACVERLNGTSVMGKMLDAFFDPFGKKCTEKFNELTAEKKPEPPKIEVKPEKEVIRKRLPPPPPKISDGKAHASYQLHHFHRRHSTSQEPPNEFHHDHHHHHRENKHDNMRVYHPSYSGLGQYNYAPSFQQYGSYNNEQMSQVHNYQQHPYLENSELKYENPGDYPGTGGSNFWNGGNSPKLDLDSRIKIMLREKNDNNVFGKLIHCFVSDSESDDESKYMKARKGMAIKVEKKSDPEKVFSKKFRNDTFVPVKDNSRTERAYTSPPPSPFLTNRGAKLFNDGELDQISDDSNVGSPKEKGSLSSLSPDELPPLPRERYPRPPSPPPPPLPPPPPPPPPEPYHQVPPGYYRDGGNPFGAPPPPPVMPYHMMFNPWHGHEQVSNHQPFYPYPPSQAYPPLPNQHQYEEEIEDDRLDDENSIQELITKQINKVLSNLVGELKNVLRRDLQKRLIENLAYGKFDVWNRDHHKQFKDQTPTPKYENSDVKNDLSTIWNPFESNDLKMLDVYGAGFKSSIPKMPSFRIERKIRDIPKAQVSEDTRKQKFNDYSDHEDHRDLSKNQKRLQRRLSLSDSSQSSSDNSSSDSDSDDSSDSLSSSYLPFSKKRADKMKPLTFDTDSLSGDSDREISNERKAFEPEPKIEPSVEPVVVKTTRPRGRPPKDGSMAKSKPVVLKEKPVVVEVPIVEELIVEQKPSTGKHLDDHNYYQEYQEADPLSLPPPPPEEYKEVNPVKKQTRGRPRKHPLDIKEIKRESKFAKPPPVKKTKIEFTERTNEEEHAIILEFLKQGVDDEDLRYFKMAFEKLIAHENPEYAMYRDVKWIDHPITFLPTKPSKNKRNHLSGCARSEGFYKLTAEEKLKHKKQWALKTFDSTNINSSSLDKPIGKNLLSREARSNQRRNLSVLGTLAPDSDLLKFNQLKYRKKSLRFARSRIHDWGLFAAEPIAADEMVIEYVGQTIRSVVADDREKKYEAVGIGSSYLFRIDGENIIDATRSGNLSRFINHSCTPNCYAKIITIEARKKIVIYSKQQIAVNEEITYDYKFPIEDKKIPCLCGTSQCRGTLN